MSFEWSVSPYINHFISADTIIPNPADPQSWNRYSYVTNNPLRYTDPTGHMRVQDGPQQDRFKKSVADKYVPKPKKKDKQDGGGGIYIPSAQPTNIILETAGYDPDAIMWGFGFSGSMPSIYSVAGMEEIVLFENGKRAVFTYGGEGSSAGVGASGAAYGGLVFNLEDPDGYVGPFGSAGITVSLLDVGITASYFWDTSEAPFSPGTTQGFAVGYAPGAQASIWWSSTSYTETWRSDE